MSEPHTIDEGPITTTATVPSRNKLSKTILSISMPESELYDLSAENDSILSNRFHSIVSRRKIIGNLPLPRKFPGIGKINENLVRRYHSVGDLNEPIARLVEFEQVADTYAEIIFLVSDFKIFSVSRNQ